VGYWVPTKGETWSVVYPPTDKTGSIVYALTGAHGPADGHTAATGLTKMSRYGYVCRLTLNA
jgi:hypothetical protein